MTRFLMIVLSSFAALGICTAETDTGIVYGSDDNMPTELGRDAEIAVWLANGPSGPLLTLCNYYDPSVPGNLVYNLFAGSRLVSFKGYIEPFFGKVADFWVEGYFGPEKQGPGRPTLAHFRLNRWDGITLVRTFMIVDLYQPGSATPFVHRLVGCHNVVRVVISDDAGPKEGSSGVSNNGLAYSLGFQGMTNRQEPALSAYTVASSNFTRFEYADTNISYRGSRMRSFQCQNDTLVGKAADFWLDGHFGTGKNPLTPCVAHIIVTDKASPNGFQFLYIALYDPRNLSSPFYERLVLRNKGANHIICK